MDRVVICHDWLLQPRGAERLLVEFCSGWDGVDIRTLFLDPDFRNSLVRAQSIYVSRLNHLPGSHRYYRYFLPLFRSAVESLRVVEADLMLSISHSVAKAVPHPGETCHICYCLTPMRYLWEPELYGNELQSSVRGTALGLWSRRLKEWDLESSAAVDWFVAISRTVQKRIERIYGRSSSLIYPCIDDHFYTPSDDAREDFYLIVSGLVPQKRLDLAIQAFNRRGDRLVVVGSGPMKSTLQRRARPNIQFLGWQSDAQIRQLYRRARALIFPGLEDFGLVPVEALACGCPVVAFGEGGVTEIARHGVSALFFTPQTSEALGEALDAFDPSSFDPQALRKAACRFSRDRFRSQWRQLLREKGFEGVLPW